MDNIEEKSVVKIDADGGVLKCAKGADVSECGYKAGAKVCGKCGAMAAVMEQKDDSEDAETPEDEVVTETPEAEEAAPEESAEGATDETEDEVEAKGLHDRKAKRKATRQMRLVSLGFKADDVNDDDLFLCAATREVKSLSQAQPCADCTGGCFSTDDAPDLLEVEGLAEDMIGGKALYSAYSDKFDMFVVQMRRKDDTPVEVYFDGEGNLDGWLRVPESELYVKEADIVDIQTAVAAATEAVEGKALAIAVGQWDGQQAYVVEIDGVDGKSYDVAVSLTDGAILGKDEVVTEEKAMYSEEERAAMAEAGEALPDGSYPIKDVEDLKNAIQAYGRAKDKGAAKEHIIKRANDLDAADLIPEEWSADEGEAEEAKEAEEKAAVTADEIDAALLELTLIEAQSELGEILGND